MKFTERKKGVTISKKYACPLQAYFILKQYINRHKNFCRETERRILAKIRTEILIESIDSLTIKRRRYSIRAFCKDCRRTSIMVLPTEAAFLSGQDINLIIALMLANSLHVRHLDEKHSFVCLMSLCRFSFEDPNEENGLEFLEIASETRASDFTFINEEFLKNET